jgi:hypothetical protein
LPFSEKLLNNKDRAISWRLSYKILSGTPYLCHTSTDVPPPEPYFNLMVSRQVKQSSRDF